MSRLRAYAQLVRLPNVFTALADICLGALAIASLPQRWPAFLALLGASACLYSAGMVWNDFFDLEQDRRERPSRPIPSGRVSSLTAALLGTVLFGMGLALAVAAGLLLDSWAPLTMAGILVAAILLYDGWLKRTWAGPLGMGLCRFLNVLLGLSLGGGWPDGWRFHLAAVVGVYIVGVTWFARTEARVSNQTALTLAAGVMLAGLVLALPIPAWVAAGSSSPLFPYLLVALGFLVGIPVGRAIAEPAPKHVQAAVKRAIMGLVVLDAVLATALAGSVGLLILALLLPALYLGRWIYST
jgi:4-hydroxybenzoate polyprenyltransferase